MENILKNTVICWILILTVNAPLCSQDVLKHCPSHHYKWELSHTFSIRFYWAPILYYFTKQSQPFLLPAFPLCAMSLSIHHFGPITLIFSPSHFSGLTCSFLSEIIFTVINARGMWRPCCWPIWDPFLFASLLVGLKLKGNTAILVSIYCCFYMCVTAICNWKHVHNTVANSIQWNMGKYLARHYILLCVFSGNKSIIMNKLLVINCLTVYHVSKVYYFVHCSTYLILLI